MAEVVLTVFNTSNSSPTASIQWVFQEGFGEVLIPVVSGVPLSGYSTPFTTGLSFGNTYQVSVAGYSVRVSPSADNILSQGVIFNGTGLVGGNPLIQDEEARVRQHYYTGSAMALFLVLFIFLYYLRKEIS